MHLDSKIKLSSDFTGKSATVKTKGLYCVIYHGPKKDEYEHRELLTAKTAIFYASLHNGLRYLDRDDATWAEPISYKDLRERYDREIERDSREKSIERRVTERLAEAGMAPKEIDAEKAEPQLPAHDELTEPLVQVLETGNGTAQVSTVGLCRLVIQPGNIIKGELMPAADAEAYATAFNSYHPQGELRAEAVAYPQADQCMVAAADRVADQTDDAACTSFVSQS